MGIFDKYYARKEEALADAKKPFTAKKVKRAFESAVDSLESAKIDLLEKIENTEKDIANGNTDKIKQLVEYVRDLEEFDEQIKVVQKLQKEFFDNN